jgi:hypothetical protein
VQMVKPRVDLGHHGLNEGMRVPEPLCSSLLATAGNSWRRVFLGHLVRRGQESGLGGLHRSGKEQGSELRVHKGQVHSFVEEKTLQG